MSEEKKLKWWQKALAFIKKWAPVAVKEYIEYKVEKKDKKKNES